jgi:hypothetical protein
VNEGCFPAIDVTVLDPARLNPQAERAAAELLDQGQSENSVRSYRAALRVRAAWYVARYRHSIIIPVTPDVLLQFVIDHAWRLDASGNLTHELPPRYRPSSCEQSVQGAAWCHGPQYARAQHRRTVSGARRSKPGEPMLRRACTKLLTRTRRAYAMRGARAKGKETW